MDGAYGALVRFLYRSAFDASWRGQQGCDGRGLAVAMTAGHGGRCGLIGPVQITSQRARAGAPRRGGISPRALFEEVRSLRRSEIN